LKVKETTELVNLVMMTTYTFSIDDVRFWSWYQIKITWLILIFIIYL